MNEPITPLLSEVQSFIDNYGWQSRITTAENDQKVLIAPYSLKKTSQGVLISFRVEGEFVMVSTVGLLKKVPPSFAQSLLTLNDRIKLVKIYNLGPMIPEEMNLEIGFELWGGSWNQETFHAFMDMLCLGIEEVLSSVSLEKIPHQTDLVTYT